MADDQTGKRDFEVSTRLLGSDIQFRDGSTTRLGAHLIARKLFRENRTGAVSDLNEMLSDYYRRTGSTPESLIAPLVAAEAFDKGISTGRHGLNFSLAPGAFGFRANEGMKDIERIDFDLELTVRPRKDI